jgi:hypothetical protein
MRRSTLARVTIIANLIMFGLPCSVRSEVGTNIIADIEVVLSSNHGVYWGCGDAVLQAFERMKTNPDEYLLAIDAMINVGCCFTNGPVTVEKFQSMKRAFSLVKNVGEEEGKNLLRKWYRLCTEAESDIRRTQQEMTKEKSNETKTWLSMSRAEDQVGACLAITLGALAELNDDSLVDECVNELIQGKAKSGHEVVMMQYIRSVAKGRNEVVTQMEDLQKKVKRGSIAEMMLPGLLQSLRNE